LKVIEIFKNVYKVNGKLATRNLAVGRKVYDEELIQEGGKEYRLWNPYRSKLAAAILKGLRHMYIMPGSKVLYLGAATGTTCSHVSDIIGESGALYCVEISERNMRQLLELCDARHNMFPILQDARLVEKYKDDVGTVDILYQDVSSRDQLAIFNINSAQLKPGGIAYVVIKSQSISTAMKPEVIYRDFINAISRRFEVLEKINIMPYDRMHLFLVLRKK